MGEPLDLNHGQGRHRHFLAPGAIYGKRLAEVLSDMGKTVRLVSPTRARSPSSTSATPRPKPWQNPQAPSSKTPKTSEPSPPGFSQNRCGRHLPLFWHHHRQAAGISDNLRPARPS